MLALGDSTWLHPATIALADSYGQNGSILMAGDTVRERMSGTRFGRLSKSRSDG